MTGNEAAEPGSPRTLRQAHEELARSRRVCRHRWGSGWGITSGRWRCMSRSPRLIRFTVWRPDTGRSGSDTARKRSRHRSGHSGHARNDGALHQQVHTASVPG